MQRPASDDAQQHVRRISDASTSSSSSTLGAPDPEYTELCERDAIFDKYERGPDDVKVDDWENPAADIFTHIDRFGFVHKTVVDKDDVVSKLRKRDMKRDEKWIDMLKNWKSDKVPGKLHERVWKGIPMKLRAEVWMRLLGARTALHSNPNVYQELLIRAKLTCRDVKQIDLDINRTYRDHEAFRRRYDIKQRALLNVLAAYAVYNTEVGYCQGMSQIAALFLMLMDEEEAFWCLHQLMVGTRHGMHGFFAPGFPKLQRFEAHFQHLTRKYVPKVYKHLEKQGVPYVFLTKWWFGCFLDRVPFRLALRVWDVFILEGDRVLLSMALLILKIQSKRIRKLSMENFMEFIQSTLPEDFGFEDDVVMRELQDLMHQLQQDGVIDAPPPSADSLPELPTKALGPILRTDVNDIRAHRSEVQSRHSQRIAHSVGASPSGHRHRRTTGGSSEQQLSARDGFVTYEQSKRMREQRELALKAQERLHEQMQRLQAEEEERARIASSARQQQHRPSVTERTRIRTNADVMQRPDRHGSQPTVGSAGCHQFPLDSRLNGPQWRQQQSAGQLMWPRGVRHAANHVTYVTVLDDSGSGGEGGMNGIGATDPIGRNFVEPAAAASNHRRHQHSSSNNNNVF